MARSGRAGTGGPIPTKYRFPRMVEETHGPWLGVRDGPAITEGDTTHAQMILNGWVADPGKGAVLPRPTINVRTSAPMSGAAVIGAAVWTPSGAPPVMYCWTSPGWCYQIGAGLAVPWGNPVRVPALDQSGGPQSRVFAVNFAGQLIVSDGTSAPVAWNGATATPILFDGVTHTPAYGPPTVYYDQVFFILGAATTTPQPTTTLIWSEVNAPTVGYIQTVAGFTYADTWTLGQTGTEPISAICGTNSALFYWRKSSCGALYGSPALNFATTATHDAISNTIGCVAPASVVLVDREIYFLDQQGRPHVIVSGGFVQGMWEDCYNTVVSTYQGATGLLALAPLGVVGVFDPGIKMLYWNINYPIGPGNPKPTALAVFDPRTKKFLGFWTTAAGAPAAADFTLPFTVPAGFTNAFPIPLGPCICVASADGYVRQFDATDVQTALVGLVTTFQDSSARYVDRLDWTQPGNPGAGANLYTVPYQIETSEMGYDPWIETLFDRVEWVTLPFTYCDVLADYKTARSTTYSRAQGFAQPVTANLYRGEISLGVSATSRFLRPRLTNTPHTNSASMNCIAVVQVRVRGFQTDMNPGSP